MSDQTANGAAPYIVCDNLVKIFKVADLEVVALQGLGPRRSQGRTDGDHRQQRFRQIDGF